jgi:hypothetical protein
MRFGPRNQRNGQSEAESHCSVINWEYDVVRGTLTEISQEGILRKRQQDLIHSSALHTLDYNLELSYPFLVKRTET